MKQIIIILLFYATMGNCFTLNSSTDPNLKGWSNSNVKIYLNPVNCPSNIDVAAIIKDAVEVWNKVPNSAIQVSYGGETSLSLMSDPTVAYCETNFQALLGANQDYVPGGAAVNGSSGRITQGILYLNASTGLANIGNFNRTKLKIILAHEIGHLLGLGHSSNESALMYYDASSKQEFRLSQDDIDGVTYLYPDSNLEMKDLAGCALIQRSTPSNNKVHLVLIGIMLLPLLLALFLKNQKKLKCLEF